MTSIPEKMQIAASVSAVRSNSFVPRTTHFRSLTLWPKEETFLSKVLLPETQDRFPAEAWICAHASDFYSMVYSLYLFCEKDYWAKFNSLGAGFPDGISYMWKGAHYSGPNYVKHVFQWIEDLINNPEVFVDGKDVPFPADFKTIISKLYTRMLRILGIFILVEGNYFKKNLEQHQKLHDTLKRFIFFTRYWQLIDFTGHDVAPLIGLISEFDKLMDFELEKVVNTKEALFSEKQLLLFLKKYENSGIHVSQHLRANFQRGSVLRGKGKTADI